MMAQLLRPAAAMRTAALLLCLLLPVTARAGELVRELEVQPGASLRIELERGNVEVTRQDGGRVRLEARSRGVGADSVRFLVSQDDGEIVLRSVAEPWLSWLRSGPRVQVRVWAPRGLRLEVETAGRIVTRDEGVERSYVSR
jgi:hypothetical protein